uniref:Uncharacterized protein n=1 Tax=Arundo donax TaxID=35708 RepID=A0A0A9C494_ARUDO
MVVVGVRNPNPVDVPGAGDLTIEHNLGVEKAPMRSSVARCGEPPSCSSAAGYNDSCIPSMSEEGMVDLERGSTCERRCLALTWRRGSSWC